MKILAFAGSLRKDSCNKKFVREAVRLLDGKAEAEFIDLKDFPMPPYDGDIEQESGIPDSTKKLSERILAADALVISIPEYNGGISGTFKNVIDWLSRVKPAPLQWKHVLLLAASPGALGGVRGLWHSRQPLEDMKTYLFPGMMGLPGAYDAFDENGRLKDEKKIKQLQELLEQFVKHASK